MSTGTISELDPIDALGWIDMDDGSRVRFGGTAISGFKPTPGVGTRVRVEGTTPGYKGVTKATRVVPVDSTPTHSTPPEPEPEGISWNALLARHPRWSDVNEVCVSPALDVPPRTMSAHPLFEPWRSEFASSPISVSLSIPTHSAPKPVKAAPDICFALGNVAFLDQTTWPTCGRCSEPFEMCIQIEPGVMQHFGGKGRGFVALFCFDCGVRHPHDSAVGHVGWTRSTHRVTRPDGPTRSSRPASPTQSVATFPPARHLPSTMWFVLRSERTSATAASVIMGRDAKHIERPFPDEIEAWLTEEGLQQLHPEDVKGTLDEWFANNARLPSASPPLVVGHYAQLGGAPSWDQADMTPDCPDHGPMLQLLEYEGGQFLDGSLHAFVCSAYDCAMTRFVAEF